MDFSQVFAANGNLPGDYIVAINALYTHPNDITMVASSIIDSGLQLSITMTGGNNGGAIAQQIYQIVAEVLTFQGNIVTWQDQFQVLTPIAP
jgi:hypothetical protein